MRCPRTLRRKRCGGGKMNNRIGFMRGAPLALLHTLCLNAAAAGLLIAPAQAQDSGTTVEEEIVVTGYRGSLRSSTTAKRDAANFTESIFAEDIGKFPDLNI